MSFTCLLPGLPGHACGGTGPSAHPCHHPLSPGRAAVPPVPLPATHHRVKAKLKALFVGAEAEVSVNTAFDWSTGTTTATTDVYTNRVRVMMDMPKDGTKCGRAFLMLDVGKATGTTDVFLEVAGHVIYTKEYTAATTSWDGEDCAGCHVLKDYCWAGDRRYPPPYGHGPCADR